MKFSGIISLLLCAAVSVTALAGCSGNKTLSGAVNTGKYSSDLSGEYLESGKVCENDRFELYWDNTKKYVWFKEKATQTVYSTIADGALTPVYDEDGILKKNNPLAESPILVYYLDSKTISEKYLNVAVNVLEEGETYTESIENGLRVTYDFAEAEISVPVEYTLNKDSFKATVITKDIKDNGENYVTAVALSPFSCSVKNDTENSWLFLPDGSGALLSTATTDLIGTQGSMSVYGTDPTVQSYHLEAYKKQVSMPVFGMKNGSKALFGIITSGAEGADLAWNVGSQNVGYSAVYPFFRIRGYNLIHAPEGFTTTQVELQTFDDRINTAPLSVSYYPLTGDNADYNGMAQLYRNYLTENKLLSKTEKTMPAVSIKLLGGVLMKKYTFGIPRTVLYTLTSVNDAAEITEYFSKELDGNILVSLVGFGETGLDFGKVGGGFKIPSSLGGKKDIKRLSDYCKKIGVPLFLDFDIIAFNKSGAGFKLTRDAAAFPNGQNAYDVRKDYVTRKETGLRYNLLSRSRLDGAAEKAADTAEKYGFSGVSLTSLSNTAYSDYKVNGAFVCGNTEKQVSGILSGLRKNTEVLTSAPNVYAAAGSSYATDAPAESSGLDVAFADIPFYSMVFRGSTALSGESVNLAADENTAILKCIESGLPLTYTLYKNYRSSLLTVDQSALAGALFESSRERIVSSYKELKSVFEKLGSSAIREHRIEESGLRVTVFENGVRIAVNETAADIAFNGETVKSMSYKIITEG